MNFENISIKELAGFICETLRKNGIDAVLVGGACVSIYTENRYHSYDLDFVSYKDIRDIEKILVCLGFKRIGRQFSMDGCPYLLDFVNPPVAIGGEPIKSFETLKSFAGSFQLLNPTDCVKDRLASFYHWNDKQGLEQAVNICLDQEIDFKEVERWSKVELHEEKYRIFEKLLEKKR